jgi:hypothetical protein
MILKRFFTDGERMQKAGPGAPLHSAPDSLERNAAATR